MYNVLFRQGQKVPVKMWNNGVPFEHAVFDQVSNIAKLPFVIKHVAVMPDAHYGKGSTVGSVIATKGAVIPAAVGVDIGCGMIACRLSLTASQLPDSLTNIFNQISADVPVGQAQHSNVADKSAVQSLEAELKQILAISPEIESHIGRKSDWTKSLGTLGGGNHFIELCLDENDDVWIMVHSGSRNIGNAIGKHFIELAKKDMQIHHINVPDTDLSYLSQGTQHYDNYVRAVEWAQKYAAKNRAVMLDLILKGLSKYLPEFTVTQEAVNCHHNYIAIENHFNTNVIVTRKGAIRARVNDLGIIPGSMGAKSYIVRGKGNAESFCSCSHGAGRVLSRGKAKEVISLADHVEATKGIMCRKDEGVLDESPAAYKDIEAVMAAQADLVEIVHTLKQVLCIKG